MARACRIFWTRVCLVFILLRADWALAATNRTIDDADPQVTYFPDNQWSQGSTCDSCRVKLDPDQTFDQTWHDTSHLTTDSDPRFLQVRFTGTAVYVVNVLANAVSGISTTTSLQFTLDGAEDGTFLHTPSESPDPEFNVVVYAREGLDNTEHTLIMQAADTPDSVILFDFILYTVPDESVTIDPIPSTTTITSTSLDHITTTITSVTTSSVITISSSLSETDRVSKTSATGPPPSSPASSPSSTSSAVSTPILAPSPSPSSSPSTSPSTTSHTSSSLVISSSVSGSSSPASARSTAKPTGLIVGATVGGIGVLAFIATLILVLRRRASNGSNHTPPFSALETEKGDSGAYDPTTTEHGADSEYSPNQVPESGSSVLLIGNPEHPPTSPTATPARFPSWNSSTEASSYSSYPPSPPMRVPSISDLYSAPADMEVREAALASSTFLVSTRPQSEKSLPSPPLPSPPTNHARALPPLPRGVNMTPGTPRTGTTSSSWDRTSTQNSSVYAQLAALQQEVERLRVHQEAPPRYDQA